MCFDILQGTPLSGKELCDAHAVPGSASPPGSCGIVGKERQSEVSCLCCSVCPRCVGLSIKYKTTLLILMKIEELEHGQNNNLLNFGAHHWWLMHDKLQSFVFFIKITVHF